MTFRYRGEHRLGTVRVPQIPRGGVDTDVQYLGDLDDDAAAAKAQEIADHLLGKWSTKIGRPPASSAEEHVSAMKEVSKEIAS